MSMVKSVLPEGSEKKLYTVEMDASVLDALKVMAEADTGAVLVCEADKIIGIFTERDYARNVEVKGLDAKSAMVKDLMTKNMVVVEPSESVQRALNLMHKFHIRHLPVVEDGSVVGVVSLRKLADAMLADHKEVITGLENYIMGTDFRS